MTEKTITIDGVEHEFESLSDDQRQVVLHVQRADNKIQEMQELVAILTTGRQAYINDLGKALNADGGTEFTADNVTPIDKE
tara:strand:+ start:28 stop:270 length:243 start_codon:yes stop_codon:yes gene_type:complete